MQQPSDKDINRANDILIEMIGPRCGSCGGCDVEVAVKWAGEKYGWCYCGSDDNDC